MVDRINSASISTKLNRLWIGHLRKQRAKKDVGGESNGKKVEKRVRSEGSDLAGLVEKVKKRAKK